MSVYPVRAPGLIERARTAFCQRVEGSIRPMGSVFDFDERDALRTSLTFRACGTEATLP